MSLYGGQLVAGGQILGGPDLGSMPAGLLNPVNQQWHPCASNKHDTSVHIELVYTQFKVELPQLIPNPLPTRVCVDGRHTKEDHGPPPLELAPLRTRALPCMH